MSDRMDPVRGSSPDSANREIDQQTLEALRPYADNPALVERRLEELREEWDIERMLAANASSLILVSLGLGKVASPKWRLLTAIVPAFLLQHALQGWCPPIEVIRRLGVRSRQEIDREVYALKALRGDFTGAPGNPEAAFHAAKVR